MTATPSIERSVAFRYGWPIAILTAGMPVLFAVGLQGLAWSIPFVAFGFALLGRPDVRVPKGVGWLILLVGWTALSVVEIRAGGSFLLFAYRWSLWAGTLVSVLWLANLPTALLSTERVERWLALLWVWMMAFGVVAVFDPIDTRSPIQLVLGPLGRSPFVDDISRWRLAEVQTVLHHPFPRPSAPFPMTNGWGAAVGLLAPFFIKVWLVDARGRKRLAGLVILAVSLLPLAYSANRGMLLSVAVALVYWAIRRALAGHIQVLAVLVLSATAIFGVLYTTGGLSVIQDRLTKVDDSNTGRASLYRDAIAGAKESPLLGHGAPENTADGLPPVGTHGLVWYLLFVHGYPSLILFALWLGGEIIRSGRIRGPDDWWPHLCLVIAGIQVVFYGLLPQIILIGVAAGLARRNALAHRQAFLASATPEPRSTLALSVMAP